MINPDHIYKIKWINNKAHLIMKDGSMIESEPKAKHETSEIDWGCLGGMALILVVFSLAVYGLLGLISCL